jgi:hypothetical protein
MLSSSSVDKVFDFKTKILAETLKSLYKDLYIFTHYNGVKYVQILINLSTFHENFFTDILSSDNEKEIKDFLSIKNVINVMYMFYNYTYIEGYIDNTAQQVYEDIFNIYRDNFIKYFNEYFTESKWFYTTHETHEDGSVNIHV